METEKIIVDAAASVQFNYNVDYCVGTGRLGLALTEEYETIYILSGEIGLYEKYGFVKISDEETVYGTVDQLFQKRLV